MSNIITFPVPFQVQPQAQPKRSLTSWRSAKEVANLLKEAGWNSSKVSVKAPRLQYVTVTVRDASVDVAAVKEFCDNLDTWSMGLDDVASGQSITVQTTEAVNMAHAAPFVETIKKAASALAKLVDEEGDSDNQSVAIDGFQNTWLFLRGNRVSLINTRTNKSSSEHWAQNILTLKEDSINFLALSLARTFSAN